MHDTELFEVGMPSVKDEADFIKNVCQRFGVTPTDIHDKLTADCVSGRFDSPLCQGVKSLFRFDCLCGSYVSPAHHPNHYLFTKLFAHLIAGPKGIEELTLKNFDYSDRCSLVWIGDYFAYRCRTCGLTPSMSLCGACFTAGNHENHDFNKFKSMCGGACDCGDPSVIRPSGDTVLYALDDEDGDIAQDLVHTTLLESFLFMIVKLRFPESLSTLLIGLLPINDFKVSINLPIFLVLMHHVYPQICAFQRRFIDAYVDHYSRISSTLMITSRVRNISPEAAMQLNNRIVHISVQLFSGVDHAYRMVKEKSLHYLIVKWMRNMFALSRTVNWFATVSSVLLLMRICLR
ncbi:unnamed protein product [Hydatigera taeniaeformis]|uniref:E3 ubiquitin-protein ligase n=1 Tax=Hydatigena taeniaeformis TaxID=6205 RepID=A0A0R3XD18_HYDTA|nr:unnamed protein product [Hydatigera taeniaeformis]